MPEQPSQTAAQTRSLLDAYALQEVERFVVRVNERAEAAMLKFHKLEGAHKAAMEVELAVLREWGDVVP